MAEIRNPFIYDSCAAFGIAAPDIPVNAQRHFGQCAEDLIVVALLRAIAKSERLDLTKERYLEIGANHPLATSATYLLQVELGMTGVLVEANSRLIPDLQKVRTRDKILNVAITNTDEPHVDFFISAQSELSSLSRRFVEEWRGGEVGLDRVERIPAQRIGQLLKTEFAKRAPMVLSVDIEGLDLDILKDIDWTIWRPAVVQTEPSDHFLPDNSTAIAQFLQDQGYDIIARTPVNLIARDRRRGAIFSPSGERMASTENAVKDLTSHLAELQARYDALVASAERRLDAFRTGPEGAVDLDLLADLVAASPRALRSAERLRAIRDGNPRWWRIALRHPWKVSLWQAARRLQRLSR